MFVLAVDINQQFTQLTQGLDVDRGTIDESARAAVFRDAPAYDAVIIFIELMFIEPA